MLREKLVQVAVIAYISLKSWSWIKESENQIEFGHPSISNTSIAFASLSQTHIPDMI